MHQKVDVLDKGYVRLRGHMGDDLTVVDSARVSFDKKSSYHFEASDSAKRAMGHHGYHGGVIKTMRKEDKRLLRYLAREGHWSPFSHPHVMLEVKAPVMVVNQIYKHRIGSRFTEVMDDPWNEMSGRYVSEDLEFYQPGIGTWRSAPDNKKQGSGEPLTGFSAEGAWNLHALNIRDCLRRHAWAIENGVAPEQARLFLPYAAMYTKLLWTPSLFTVLRFLQLREDEHAQWEIRQYAEAVRELVQPRFPESFQAFEEVSNV